MMSFPMIMLYILLSGLITQVLRSLPFIVFYGDRQMPAWLDRLGMKLPAAIMAVLVIYCLKDFGDDVVGIGIPKLIAVALVVISYKWKHNTFISIFVGTLCYMVLIRII